jgi:hypothetical protein
MALKRVLPCGVEIHGPPYTKAEEAAFYAAWSKGPQTIVREKKPDEPTGIPPAPDRSQRPQGKRRGAAASRLPSAQPSASAHLANNPPHAIRSPST